MEMHSAMGAAGVNLEQLSGERNGPRSADGPVFVDTDYVARPEDRALIIELSGRAREGAQLFAAASGSGKTFLLHSAIRSLAGRGLYVQVSPNEREWPLSGLSTLLALSATPQSMRLMRQLEDLADRPVPELGEAMLDEIRAMKLGSITMLIDDVDLMDDRSLQVIGYLAKRLGGTGLRLVATVTERPDVGGLAGLPCRELPPLDLETTFRLAREMSGSDGDAAVAAAASAYSSGNPLTLRQILQQLSPRQLSGRDPLDLPLRQGPRTLAEVRRQLDGLSVEARTVLETLSTAPITPANLPGLAVTGIEELREHGLIERNGPWLAVAQLRVRASVYWQIPAGRRLEEHQRLAAALADSELMMARWHASFGAEPPSVHELLGEALNLVKSGRLLVAPELVERALTIGPIDVDAAQLLVDIAEGMLSEGMFAGVVRLNAFAGRASGEPLLHLRIASLQVRLAFTQRQELLEGVVRSAVHIFGHANSGLTMQLLDYAAFCSTELWQVSAARRWWEWAEEFRSPEDEVTPYHRSILEYIEAVEGRLRTSPLTVEVVPGRPFGRQATLQLLLLGRNLTFRERYVEAREALSAVQLSTLHPVDSRTRLVFTLENELRAGNFHKASEAVRELAEVPGIDESHIAMRACLLARFWSEMGEPERVGHWVATVDRIASTNHGVSLAARVQASLGRAQLLRGNYENAIRSLSRADQLGAAFANPLLVTHEGDLIDALALAGRLDEAADSLARFENRLQQAPSRWGELVLGRCQAILQPGRHGVTALRRNLANWPVQSHSGPRYEYEYARTVLALGQRHHELDQQAEASDAFDRAAAEFGAIGQRATAAMIGRAGQGAGVGGDGAGAGGASSRHPEIGRLNEGERLVVEKVLSGKKNREIAQELFVSLRTVEVRLTNIYRRMGVRSRAQLMARLNNPDADSSG